MSNGALIGTQLNGGTSKSTIAYTLPTTGAVLPAVGSVVLAAVRTGSSNSIGSVSDPRGNSWTEVAGLGAWASGANSYLMKTTIGTVWRPGDTITFNAANSNPYMSVVLGYWPPGYVDTVETNPAPTTNKNAAAQSLTVSITPLESDEELISAFANGQTTTGAAPTVGAAFNLIGNTINCGLAEVASEASANNSETAVWSWGVNTTASGLCVLWKPANQPPIADAGADQDAIIGNVVALDGSGSSDPNGGSITSWAWTITGAPSGSTAALTAANTVAPQIMPDDVGDYTISLVVQNSEGLTSTADTMTITAANQPTASTNPPTMMEWTGSQGVRTRIVIKRPDGAFV